VFGGKIVLDALNGTEDVEQGALIGTEEKVALNIGKGTKGAVVFGTLSGSGAFCVTRTWEVGGKGVLGAVNGTEDVEHGALIGTVENIALGTGNWTKGTVVLGALSGSGAFCVTRPWAVGGKGVLGAVNGTEDVEQGALSGSVENIALGTGNLTKGTVVLGALNGSGAFCVTRTLLVGVRSMSGDVNGAGPLLASR
jgi:hypothetical protein